jgi:hypothetical protein
MSLRHFTRQGIAEPTGSRGSTLTADHDHHTDWLTALYPNRNRIRRVPHRKLGTRVSPVVRSNSGASARYTTAKPPEQTSTPLSSLAKRRNLVDLKTSPKAHPDWNQVS